MFKNSFFVIEKLNFYISFPDSCTYALGEEYYTETQQSTNNDFDETTENCNDVSLPPPPPSPEILNLQIPFSGSLKDFNEPLPSANVIKGAAFQSNRSPKSDLKKEKSAVLKSISDIEHSKSIHEMINKLKEYPDKVFADKSVKPLTRKLEKDFNTIMVKGASILEKALKLEKAGKNKKRKQVAELQAKLKVR